MLIRERTEALEVQLLAPEAAKSKDARRDRPEEKCPFRTEYQRDRDRILHSKCFRRLKHKTQVYIMSGDHYRTRMTHSLEVAQISRTIARGLQLNEDLAEAIGLGHDVGHTPFGHSGEAVLDELVQPLGRHFCHNEQSLRIVEYLEKDGRGLNLTEAVRDGIVNHTGGVRPFTLEGRIVHIADRIAYLCHDYDDSIRAGLLQPGDLPQMVHDFLGKSHSQMITAFVSDVIGASAGSGDILQSSGGKAAMDEFRAFMFKHIYHSDSLAKEREQACYVLRELYRYFSTHFDRLPEAFRAREARWGREQCAIDYVAGLTDSYAVQLFQEIFIPPVGLTVRLA